MKALTFNNLPLHLSFFLIILMSHAAQAQEPSAIVDFESSTQGALLPRMTTAERLALPGLHTPAQSLIVYDIDTESFWYWKDNEWVALNDYAFESTDYSDSTITAIPDDDSIIVSLIATEPGILEHATHIRVCVDITHPYLQALSITLVAPDGVTRVDLSSNNGNIDYTHTCFEAIGPSITSGNSPFTGTWSPEESFDKLVGQTIAGNWSLVIADNDTPLDMGELNYWSIEFDQFNIPQSIIANNSFSTRVSVDLQNDSNQIGLFTSGLERMRIDQSGLIGINTDNPSARLTITDYQPLNSIDGQGILQLEEFTSGNNLVMDYASIQSRNGTSNSTVLRLQPWGGSVGIGTGGASYSPLQVASQGRTISSLIDNGVMMIGDIFSDNMIFDHQTIQARQYPNISNLKLQPLGGYVTIWDYEGLHLLLTGIGIQAANGIGSPPSVLQLNANGGNVGIRCGTTYPISSLHIRDGNGIYSSSDHGYLTIGNETSKNITFDFNNIQARDNGQGATLNLNPYGGNVGIGSHGSAQFPLHVIGSSNYSNNNPAHYLHSTSGVGSSGVGWSYSIHASSGVYSGLGFGTGSDARIKNIIGRSDGQADLNRLMEIEITDYQMIDSVEHGNQIIKKVIAQQVENVLPEAVTQNLDIIPDIYSKANIEDGWIRLATDLKIGERVNIISEEQRGIYVVTHVENHRFKIENKAALTEGDTIFVYGREVADFRSIDYDALSMLNISATQELHRLIDAQRKEIKQLKANYNQITADLEELKAALAN